MSDKKQKVLIVHNYYQIPGGEDMVVANEKKMLEEKGHEVLLYTRHNSELKRFSKLRKLMLPFSTVFNIKTYRDVRRLIKNETIDLVHVHNTLNLISPSVYYAAFACKVPVVQTVHNFRLLCPGATFYRDGQVCEDCLKKGLGCAVKHKCYRGSRVQTLACVISTLIHRVIGTYGRLHYICLTEFNKEKLLQLKQIHEEQVFVKPNFAEAATETVPYQERKKQFVYVGRLDELKGIDFLIKAWEVISTDDCKLVVCGIGPLEEWCKEYVRIHQLHNVELKGFVENINARKMIGESRALILPTRWYEGFPMTIIESFSVGTPVVCTDLGNAGSLIEDGKNGWKFQPESVDGLADAVRKINHSFEGLEEGMIHKYSAENNYEQLRKIYEACCNHH